MNFQSARALQIKPSPSMAVSLAARRMRAKGDDVIDLGLGEPDFHTPAAYRRGRLSGGEGRPDPLHRPGRHARTCAQRSPQSSGARTASTTRWTRSSSANGAKQIVFNALMATLEPGDEVILPAPYLVSYTDIVVLLGGAPAPWNAGWRTASS